MGNIFSNKCGVFKSDYFKLTKDDFLHDYKTRNSIFYNKIKVTHSSRSLLSKCSATIL